MIAALSALQRMGWFRMKRASRRTPDERAAILGEVERGPDGVPVRGAYGRVARRHGLNAGTLRSWVSRDGWPPSAPELAQARAAELVEEPPPAPATAEQDATAAPSTRSTPPAEPAPVVVVAGELGGLEPQHATAVRLRVEGQSYRAIARELGRGETTVRTWFREGPVASAFRRVQGEHAAETAATLTSAAATAGRTLAQALHGVEAGIAAARSLQADALRRGDRTEAAQWGAQISRMVQAAAPAMTAAFRTTGVLENGIATGAAGEDVVDRYLDSLTDEEMRALAEDYFQESTVETIDAEISELEAQLAAPSPPPAHAMPAASGAC